MSLLIDCQNLCKTYNIAQNVSKEVKALKNVSFQLNEGDRLGLVGLNGSGKSTLLKILSGIVKPSSGKVELYRKVQNLSGFDSLLQPDLTGRENAVFHLKLNGFKNSEILPNINEILDFSELGTFFELPVKNYSSGMLLRLSFSIFKILKPEILLLDEVFSAGDMRFQKKAEVFFKEYFNKLSGLILASHQLSEIAEYCNKCLVLNKGEVEFLGSVEEAVKKYIIGNTIKNTQSQQDTINFISLDFSGKGHEPTYFREEEIKIALSAEILNTTEAAYPTIFIETALSKVLVASPIFENQNLLNTSQKLGITQYLVSIPSNILNYGSYFISIMWGNPKTILCSFEKLASFKVVPNNIKNDNLDIFVTYYPIRPNLEWHMLSE
ncbi:MAG: ATP-binding cassette domain-containing protein [Chitinophagales bacterium]|nr:ATP-binding cassette domain-containing protein [Chitinophagales bacterium]